MGYQALLWKKDKPIIRSLLETDVYKILMLFYIWTYYPYLTVRWAFKNRKIDIPLAKYVDVGELKEQLQAVMRMSFSDGDVAYLRTWGMFSEKFLRELQQIRLGMPEVSVVNDQLVIEVEGSWFETTLWEIYILAIVAELYGKGRAKAEGISDQALHDEGVARLNAKIEFLKQFPDIVIALFGLRRRFSALWDDEVTSRFLTEVPKNISGISNVYLAKQFGIEPQGTNAHELQMAEYAIARHQGPDSVREAPYTVLERWQDLFGQKALIMLPDTFGTEAFLRDLPPRFARNWRGYRQDSGDAIEIGEMYIADYEHRGIDPMDKLVLFTDGLNCERMLKIRNHFKGRINFGFGVGTDFTNDMGLIGPLSMVMKLMMAAGNSTIKLSDNIAKAMGPEDEIELAKQIFNHTSTFNEATVY